jgi:hypothetical protein
MILAHGTELVTAESGQVDSIGNSCIHLTDDQVDWILPVSTVRHPETMAIIFLFLAGCGTVILEKWARWREERGRILVRQQLRFSLC